MDPMNENITGENLPFYKADKSVNIRKKCEDFFKSYLEEDNVNLLCEFSKDGCWKNCKRCREHYKKGG
jgi:hypothetical protein